MSIVVFTTVVVLLYIDLIVAFQQAPELIVFETRDGTTVDPEELADLSPDRQRASKSKSDFEKPLLSGACWKANRTL